MATATTLSTEDQARLREDWLTRLSALVELVERWATDRAWSTRRIEKKMADPEVGPYRAPALLLQEGVTRIILEPIGRSSPGTDGVVDLYELPAYDDIATILYRQGQWWVHYPMSADPVATLHEVVELQPLSADVIGWVLAAMIAQNA